MVFEKKKIRMETLAEYLSEVRQGSGLSLEQVSAKTGISRVFLESLESGDFSRLPADVYVCGFLKQLSEMYSLESGGLIAQFKKEKAIDKQLHEKKRARGRAEAIADRIVITPKVLTIALAAIFVSATLAYIVWQVFSINRMPGLEVFEPKPGQVVASSVVALKGRTDPGMFVSVNGEGVFVESDGSFEAQVSLTPGPKEIVVAAKNKFDKTITKNISIVGEQTPSVLSASDSAKVELVLNFSGEVELSYSLDEKKPEGGRFQKGDTKTLQADRKISLSVSDAGSVQGVLNGQPLGTLGRPGEALSDIPFSSQSPEAGIETE